MQIGGGQSRWRAAGRERPRGSADWLVTEVESGQTGGGLVSGKHGG